MSEMPEDLRHQHNIATVAYSVQCYTGREVVRLIERIARAEAENGSLQSALATSIAQTAEWTAQANQLTVANDEKAGRIIQLQERVRLLAQTERWGRELGKMSKTDELVERMRQAAISGGGNIDWHAALRVAADALLGPLTNSEVEENYGHNGTRGTQKLLDRFDVDRILRHRRASILAPIETATIQEQVERILIRHFKTLGVVDAAEEVIATLKQEPTPTP